MHILNLSFLKIISLKLKGKSNGFDDLNIWRYNKSSINPLRRAYLLTTRLRMEGRRGGGLCNLMKMMVSILCKN